VRLTRDSDRLVFERKKENLKKKRKGKFQKEVYQGRAD